MTFGDYIFEAPTGCGTNGTYYYNGEYFCQIPDFSYSSGGLGYTGHICNYGLTCRGIDTNADAVTGYYIDQGAQDTTTSSISSGTSWTETWDSSVN